MKILIFSMEYPPIKGGGGTYALNLVNALTAHYPDTSIAVMTSGTEDSVDHLNERVSIYRFRSCQHAYDNNSLSAKLIDDFKAVVTSIKPDIIHAFHSIPIIVACLTREQIKTPYVCTQHRTPEPGWMSEKLDGKGELASLAYDLGFNSTWIAPSVCFRNNLLKHGVSHTNIKTIYTSINENYFYYKDFSKARKRLHKMLRIDDDQKIVTMPVVNRPRKDIRFCLRAVDGLDPAERADISVLITGVNAGSNDILEFRELYPKVNIVEHGSFDNSIMPSIIAGSDVVVMSSLYEGFGISCIEALASGVRTAIRVSPGQEEIIKLMKQYAYPFSTIQELQQIISDSTFTTEQHRESQAVQTKSIFSQEKQASSHMEVYSRVLTQATPIPTVVQLQDELEKVFKNRSKVLLKEVDAIFISGSVAKGDYIPGWSDIDIVVICKNGAASDAVVSKIRKFQQNLTAIYKCKVGIDYISSQYLLSQSKSSLISQHEVPNLILFHEGNVDHTQKGVLYKDGSFKFPVFANDKFQYLSLDEYKEMCRGIVHETLFRAGDSLASSVKALRIVTKTCVYLLRMRVLVQSGEYIQSYDELISDHVQQYNTKILQDVYASARGAGLNNRHDVEKYTKKALTCFHRLVETL